MGQEPPFFRRAKRAVLQELRDLPPPPIFLSPKRSWRWIKARPRRLRTFRRLAIAAGIAAVIAVAWIPGSTEFHRLQAKRLVQNAAFAAEAHDFETADKDIRTALLLRPYDLEVGRGVARLLSRTGRTPEALVWWQKIATSLPLSEADRRDYAESALDGYDIDTAKEQIRILLANRPTPEPADLLLDARLSALRGQVGPAVRAAEKVLQDKSADSRVTLSAAELLFGLGEADAAILPAACARVTEIARDKSDPNRLDALTFLAQQPPAASVPGLATPFSSPSRNRCPSSIDTSEIIQRLSDDPDARGYHALVAFDLKCEADPTQIDPLLRGIMKRFAKADDQTAAALSYWLHQKKFYDAELEVATAERAMKSRELFIQRVILLTELNRVSEAEKMLLSENCIIPSTFQSMYLATLKARQHEWNASANDWQRALTMADDTRKLLILAGFAEKNNALDIADGAYKAAIARQPMLRTPYLADLHLLESMQQTRAAYEIATAFSKKWPDDTTAEMHAMYLGLLLNDGTVDPPAAEARSSDVLEKTPWNRGARMVLTLAKLKLGHSSEALETISPEGVSQAETGPAMAVRVAAFRANGWKDAARAEAQRLAATNLLPEERDLITPTLTAKN